VEEPKRTDISVLEIPCRSGSSYTLL